MRLGCGWLLLFVACARPTPSGPVRLGAPKLRIAQAVFVAAELGLFARRGLEVELSTFDTAQPLADELAAGRLDAAGHLALPILFSREGGPPPVRLATAVVEDDAHPLSFLLVRPDSPLDAVAGLAGKRVGILPTLAYRRWLEAVLAHAGVPAAEVTVVPLAPHVQLDALASGGVDALLTGDPMATAALARKLARPLRPGAEVPRALGAPFFFGSFALSERFVAARPEAAAGLVAALDEAVDRLAQEPGVGPAALRRVVGPSDAAYLDAAPPTRYLRSDEVTEAALGEALARERWAPPAATRVWRAP